MQAERSNRSFSRLPAKFTTALIAAALLPIATPTQEAGPLVDDSVLPALSAPVAFVYISQHPKGSTVNKVSAFAASPDGSLHLIPGSPFSDNASTLATNGRFLFGATPDGRYISSYSILHSGALHYSIVREVDTVEPDTCPEPGNLILDHTGSTLYRSASGGTDCDYFFDESFRASPSTGGLTYLGNSGGGTFFGFNPLTISANNLYAYGWTCNNYRGTTFDRFSALKRNTDGLITESGAGWFPAPDPLDSADSYCRFLTAADPSNHVAVAMQAFDRASSDPVGASQLATYSADASGNLSTTSTYANMPPVAVGYVTSLGMSPNGRLLAVAGGSGMQVFHFNGSHPITNFTGLLTAAPIDKVLWDNANHLYGISSASGKLYVFTVTSASRGPAPGSPHALPAPVDLIVRPLT